MDGSSRNQSGKATSKHSSMAVDCVDMCLLGGDVLSMTRLGICLLGFTSPVGRHVLFAPRLVHVYLVEIDTEYLLEC